MKLLGYCALWSLLLLAAAWVFSDPQRNSIDGYGKAWVEPGPVVDRPQIGPQVWDFDYEQIERALVKLKCDGQGLNEISETTENALRQAVEAFPLQPGEKVLHRIQFLADKNCGSENGTSLANLLMQYYHYNQALLALQEAQNQSAHELTAEKKYQQSEALREQYFGEVNAQKLFGRQQAFANYLFERQRIMSDDTLTESDKTAQLKSLRLRFQELDSGSVDPG